MVSDYQERDWMFDTGDVDCTFQRRWFGEYRGVLWEVRQAPPEDWDDGRQHELYPTGYWWYYISLVEPQFPEEVRPRVWIDPEPAGEILKRPHWRLHDHFLAELEWHGGLTYYCKHGGHGVLHRRIEGGCDYRHVWDEGRCYTFAEVHRDACRTIDSLWESIPNLRRRCPWNGNYYADGEGFERRDSGEWLSRDTAVTFMERDLKRREEVASDE